MEPHPAYEVADRLKESIESACTRIEIAGSLRRQKEKPGDIEIVCQPGVGVWTLPDMFGGKPVVHEINYLELKLQQLYDSLALRLDDEHRANGKNYKRLVHVGTGICCDLFIVTDPRKWGIIYTIRTGSNKFSTDLVTRARARGGFVQHGLLHQHAPVLDDLGKVQECADGEQCVLVRPTYDETDVFAALDLPWIPPRERETTLVDALARDHYRRELESL